MSSEILRVIEPNEYFNSFFKEGIYPNGRNVLDVQQLVFNEGECGGVGSAIVTLGGVTISCSIEASVSLISDAQLISVQIEESQQIDEKIGEEYTELLLNLFEKEFFIKRENLKCLNSKGNQLPLEWMLNISLKVLSANENILDAIIVCVEIALKNCRLPAIVLNHEIEDESIIEKSQILIDGKVLPLNINQILFCCSFGIFETISNDQIKNEILLLSPPNEIASICNATCSIIVGEAGKILLIRERGKIRNFQILKKMAQITENERQKLVEALRK